MNEEQMAQLKALPFPTFVYYDMGNGLELRKVDIEQEHPCGAAYTLKYDNGMGGELYVYGCTGGVGDIMPGDHQVSFSSIIYGSGIAEVYPEGSADGCSFRSHWIDTWRPGNFYAFAAKNLPERYINIVCDGLIELE